MKQVDLDELEKVRLFMADFGVIKASENLANTIQELRLAREVVATAGANMADYCLLVNYKTDSTLKPFCDALAAYEQLQEKG